MVNLGAIGEKRQINYIFIDKTPSTIPLQSGHLTSQEQGNNRNSMKQWKRIKCRIFPQLENAVWQGLDTALSFAPSNPNLANAICAAFSRLQPSSHLQSPSILNPHNMSKQGQITRSALQIRTLFLKNGMSG